MQLPNIKHAVLSGPGCFQSVNGDELGWLTLGCLVTSKAARMDVVFDGTAESLLPILRAHFAAQYPDLPAAMTEGLISEVIAWAVDSSIPQVGVPSTWTGGVKSSAIDLDCYGAVSFPT